MDIWSWQLAKAGGQIDYAYVGTGLFSRDSHIREPTCLCSSRVARPLMLMHVTLTMHNKALLFFGYHFVIPKTPPPVSSQVLLHYEVRKVDDDKFAERVTYLLPERSSFYRSRNLHPSAVIFLGG